MVDFRTQETSLASRLDDRRAVCELPGPEPALRSGGREPTLGEYRTFDFALPTDLAGLLWQLVGHDKTALFCVLAGCFHLVAERLGLCATLGDNESRASLIVTTPIGRDEGEVNAYLLLLLSFNSSRRFDEWAEEIRGQFARASGTQACRPPGLASISSETEPTIAILCQPFRQAAQRTLELQAWSSPLIGNVQLADNDIFGSLTYHAGQIEDACAERIGECLVRVLRTAALDPGRTLGEIDLIEHDERDQIARLSAGPMVVRPPETNVVRLFESQAAVAPDNLALAGLLELDDIYDPAASKYIVESITYGQLNARANQIARTLRANSVARNCVVGLAVEHPIHRMEAVLGVLKAGAAYLPVDDRYPGSLKEQILSDAGVRIVLADKERDCAPWIAGRTLLDIRSAIFNGESTADLAIHVNPKDLCYVCCTSGTTSRMKGVSVAHEGLTNYVTWRRKALGFTEESLTLQTVPFSADGFAANAYPTLCAGGTMVGVPEKRQSDAHFVLAVLDRFPITNMSLVPTNCQTWLSQATPRHLRSAKLVVLAGEPASDALLERLATLAPHLHIGNEYGPTEATVGATFFHGLRPGLARIIGAPIDNVTVAVLNDMNEPMPLEVPGEICIGGPGLALGYVHDASLIARQFVTNRQGRRMYRTGDKGTWTRAGQLRYLGRFDRQLKVRGHRVDLSYLEHRIREILGAADAYVLVDDARKHPHGAEYPDEALVAYVQTRRAIREGDLRKSLAEDLPDWMVPRFVVPVAELPRDRTGRVIRDALPKPSPPTEATCPEPMNDMETRVARLFARVLRLDPAEIGAAANFFSLGGHSIALTQLAALIHSEFRVNIKMSRIYQSPTVGSLARVIGVNGQVGLKAIAPTTSKEYYAASPAQEQVFISHHRGAHPIAYNTPVLLEWREPIDADRLRRALQRVIERHEALRTAFVTHGSQLTQRIYPLSAAELQIFEVDRASVQDIIDAFIRPFALDHPPLLRLALIRIGDGRNVMLLDSHHIVMDARSLALVLRDLKAFYEGREMGAQRFTYKDYSEWYSGEAQSTGFKAKERHWLALFSDGIPTLNLPTDHPRPRHLSLVGESVGAVLDSRIQAGLAALARGHESTPSSVFLSIFVMLLAKWTGQREFVVGLSVSGRQRPEWEQIVGNFAAIVPLRCSVDDATPFSELLHGIKRRSVQAIENQDYSLSHLAKRLGVKPDPSRNAIVSAVFQYINPESGDLPELLTALPLKGGPDLAVPENYVFELVLDVVQTRSFTKVKLGYSPALFASSTVSCLLQDLLSLSQQIAEESNISLAQFDLAAVARPAVAELFESDTPPDFSF